MEEMKGHSYHEPKPRLTEKQQMLQSGIMACKLNKEARIVKSMNVRWDKTIKLTEV